MLKDRLLTAQERMKFFSDKHKSKREFQVGDWVFLRLQPYRQTSLPMCCNLKLAPKFYGPHQIIQCVGKVSYKLQLPSSASIHPMFHVAMLKKNIGTNVTSSSSLPPVNQLGQFMVELVAILNRRMVKKNNAASLQVLEQWSNMPPTEAPL